MQPLKTKELADWLNLSPATVRLWTTEGYGEFLSPMGQGGEGRIRSFNEQDSRIIAFINSLKAQGTGRDEIMATLSRLQADDWNDLPPMPTAPPGISTEVINAETAQTALTTQRNALLREIAIKEERIEALEGQLQQERDMNAGLNRELATAKEELGTLRGKLTIIETERPTSRFWLAVILIITLSTIAITAAIVLLIQP